MLMSGYVLRAIAAVGAAGCVVLLIAGWARTLTVAIAGIAMLLVVVSTSLTIKTLRTIDKEP